MEDVAAPELAHLLALPHRGEAHHAVGRREATARGCGAPAGGETVLVELVGEDDEAGEAGADEAGVDGGGGVGDGSAEAEGVEEGEEEGAEVVDAAGDDGEEEEGDGVGGDVVELALQHRCRIRVGVRFERMEKRVGFGCGCGWPKELERVIAVLYYSQSMCCAGPTSFPI